MSPLARMYCSNCQSLGFVYGLGHIRKPCAVCKPTELKIVTTNIPPIVEIKADEIVKPITVVKPKRAYIRKIPKEANNENM